MITLTHRSFFAGTVMLSWLSEMLSINLEDTRGNSRESIIGPICDYSGAEGLGMFFKKGWIDPKLFSNH